MWPVTEITNKIGINFPIIQAPMAGGATTPELVAAVSNSGGLGSLGAGYMTAQAMREAIIKIRELTDKPFSVNLFIPELHHATSSQISRMCTFIEQFCFELQTKISPVMEPYAPAFEEQMQVVLEESVPVVSFTFGIPDDNWVQQLKKKGIFLIGTATSLHEARLLEASHMDAIVAQGSEAGGHRGTFIGKAENSLFKLDVLIKEFCNNVKLPVVASGGIMNGAGIISALTLGTNGVQMGTAFLSCHESGIHAKYKEALCRATKDTTTLTRVFSGKMARGIKNKFIERMAVYQDDVLDYPIQNALTRSMRTEAGKQGNMDFMSMWAGQSVHLCQNCYVSELINTLLNDIEGILSISV